MKNAAPVLSLGNHTARSIARGPIEREVKLMIANKFEAAHVNGHRCEFTVIHRQPEAITARSISGGRSVIFLPKSGLSIAPSGWRVTCPDTEAMKGGCDGCSA